MTQEREGHCFPPSRLFLNVEAFPGDIGHRMGCSSRPCYERENLGRVSFLRGGWTFFCFVGLLWRYGDLLLFCFDLVDFVFFAVYG